MRSTTDQGPRRIAGSHEFLAAGHRILIGQREPERESMRDHLSPLRDRGALDEWHRGLSDPGADSTAEVGIRLARSELIVLLVSSKFLAEDCCKREAAQALLQHREERSKVIPIRLRPVDWGEVPFKEIQFLPRSKKSIFEWKCRDLAWVEITRELRQILQDLPTDSR